MSKRFSLRTALWGLMGAMLVAGLAGCPGLGGSVQIEFFNATGLNATSLQIVGVGEGVVSEQPNQLMDTSFTNGDIFTVRELSPDTYQVLILFGQGQDVLVASFQVQARTDQTVSLILDDDMVVPVLDPFLNKGAAQDDLAPLLLVE